MTKAGKWLQANAPEGRLDVENWAWKNFPEEETCWYPNAEGGKKPVGEILTVPLSYKG